MKRHAATILLFLCALALALAVYQLFALRFEAGDVYPEYSSLRADPLGAMAFYESLQGLPGFTVSRDFSTTRRLPGTPTTYVRLAASRAALETVPQEQFREIEQFVNDGGRLAVAMYPVGSQLRLPALPKPPGQTPEKPRISPYRERWGLDFSVINLERSDDDAYVPVLVENAENAGAPSLPETLEWHSGIVFKNLHPDWKPIYLRGADPVMIERRFGRGSVVIATDSYFVSNEAMLFDRRAELLSFFIGPNRNIVFDEAHLGIAETQGVAALIRRYRLHWAVASLVLVAALFIWKMSTPLIPARSGEDGPHYVTGKDTAAGIVNLLRRSIPPDRILETCFNEWKKAGPLAGYGKAQIERAEAAFHRRRIDPSAVQDAAAAYAEITQALTRNQ